MKFIIEQIAVAPSNPLAAKQLLHDMGATSWTSDTVEAKGTVYGQPAQNIAKLSFNYQLNEPDVNYPLEFEVLQYQSGANWVDDFERGSNIVSHLGMHCTEEELRGWRAFFAVRNTPVVQEVDTISHTNPAIAGKRRYKYVIFGTKPILGVDLKFIVRKSEERE